MMNRNLIRAIICFVLMVLSIIIAFIIPDSTPEWRMLQVVLTIFGVMICFLIAIIFLATYYLDITNEEMLKENDEYYKKMQNINQDQYETIETINKNFEQSDLAIWLGIGITICIVVVMGIFATLKYWRVI